MKSMLLTSKLIRWVVFFASCGLLALLLSQAVFSQSADDVSKAMALIKERAVALGGAGTRSDDALAAKPVIALYFGSTKINNNFTIVDEVQLQTGAAATFFVRNGDAYVRVATSIRKDDGSRAIGTVLDPAGKAFAAIAKGDAYYGDASILGKPYAAGYEPIRSVDGTVIGIYFVGYPKAS